METYRTAVIREPYVRWCERDKIGQRTQPFIYERYKSSAYFTLLDCHFLSYKLNFKSMKKLFPALALTLLLCVSCTQQEQPTPRTTTDTNTHYRSNLFDTACEPSQTKTCINAVGNTRTFQTPKCASREDFLAAINHQIPEGEIFQTFPMLDGHPGLTYCQPKIHQQFRTQDIKCREQCTDQKFNYMKTGTGDWTLYLMSHKEWKPSSLVIYGLEYPYTYTIEEFENHDAPLSDGWWFEVRIHSDDWASVLDGILFSAQR